MKLMALGIDTTGGLRTGEPSPLFELPFVTEPFHAVRNFYDVTPDGQRFLVKVPTRDPGPPSISVLLNWPSAMPR